jgi:GntR family histidine utilization transcriptional repressor
MNHTKPLPLYERVKQHLLDRIHTGEWPDGARLPSEYELMETLGASRMTIHRALREMQADGLLRRAQGVGTFVQRQPPRSALLEITDIAEDIARRGNRHAARVITLETLRADAATAAIFGQRKGAKIFRSLIVHTENETPVQLEERFVTPLFAPHYINQDFATQTTAAYLQTLAPPAQIEHVIHATSPDAQTQALLQIPATEPCLQLTRRTWTAIGPATRSILTHPGSRYSLGSSYELPHLPLKKPA